MDTYTYTHYTPKPTVQVFELHISKIHVYDAEMPWFILRHTRIQSTESQQLSNHIAHNKNEMFNALN